MHHEPSARAQKVRDGDIRTIARVLTELESGPVSSVRPLLSELHTAAGKALVIGLTGSPGSGKSTLVAELARLYRARGERVGVIAVDPSSPLSGGAILGDRIRMQALSADPGVFIRSMATRGRMGGLSAAVDDAIVVLDAAGYGRILVETVGVGQDEIDIVATAHVTVLVLVPGMGDAIQAIKAGVMEIADIFVINKADHPETQKVERDLRFVQELSSREDRWDQPVVKTVATSGKGVADLLDAIERFRVFQAEGNEEFLRRRTGFERNRFFGLLKDEVQRLVLGSLNPTEREELLKRMISREVDAETVARDLIQRASE